jgi:hypothetical protein
VVQVEFEKSAIFALAGAVPFTVMLLLFAGLAGDAEVITGRG